MKGKVERSEAGRPLWLDPVVSGFSRPNPGATRPHSHQLAQLPSYTHSHLRTTGPEWLPHRLYAQPYDHVPRGRCPILQTLWHNFIFQPDLYLPKGRCPLQYRASPPWHMIVRLSIQPMWKSLWASSPQVGMSIWGKLCELVAVGPGGSGVRAAKAWYYRIGPPGLRLFNFSLH